MHQLGAIARKQGKPGRQRTLAATLTGTGMEYSFTECPGAT
jgi:hypothetical protein